MYLRLTISSIVSPFQIPDKGVTLIRTTVNPVTKRRIAPESSTGKNVSCSEGFDTPTASGRWSKRALSTGPSGNVSDMQLSLPHLPPTIEVDWGVFGEGSSSSAGNLTYSPPTTSTQTPLEVEDNKSLPKTPTRRPRSIPRNFRIRHRTTPSIDFYKTPYQTPTGFESELSGSSTSITSANKKYEDSSSEPRSSPGATEVITIPGSSISTAGIDGDIISYERFVQENENQEDSITTKELRQEIESWEELVPDKWENLVIVNPLRERSLKSLQNERRGLEEACGQRRVMKAEKFEVFGTLRHWDHDRLKCWVLFNMHQHFKDCWPPGYQPQTAIRELTGHDDGGEDTESTWSFY